MIALYIVLYVMNLALAAAMYVRRPRAYSIFSPWPGYSILFSTYFLLGTLALPRAVSDLQWLLYSLALAGFTLGCALTGALKGRVLSERGAFNDQDISIYSGSFNRPLLLTAVAIGVATTAYMWSKSGAPLLSSNVDAARAAFLDNGYIATVAGLLDVSAVMAFTLMAIAWRKGRLKGIALPVCICLLFILVAVLSGSRTRILKFIVPCVVIYNFYIKPLRLKTVLTVGFIGAVFVGGLGYYRNLTLYGGHLAQGIGSDAANWSAWRYVIYFAQKELSTAAYGLDLVVKYIPYSSPHTWGYLHVGPFLSPFQFHIPNPGEYFKEMVGGKWLGFGLAATFISPMYADFGVIGVFVLSALYAALICSAYRNAHTDPYWVPIYAMLFFFMVSAMRSDFISFELMWFLLVGYVFKMLKRGASRAKGRGNQASRSVAAVQRRD